MHLSEKEETLLNGIVHAIEQEYHANLDKFSHHIIIAQLEALLRYAERFYERQFLTRRQASYDLLERLEALLATCFTDEAGRRPKLPTVGHVAEQLHVSADYLSSLLKALTGLTTQQHIHQKLLTVAPGKALDYRS
ncbi:MAG: hypothetical protein WKG07_20500 [Hymenobacter sp.]